VKIEDHGVRVFREMYKSAAGPDTGSSIYTALAESMNRPRGLGDWLSTMTVPLAGAGLGYINRPEGADGLEAALRGSGTAITTGLGGVAGGVGGLVGGGILGQALLGPLGQFLAIPGALGGAGLGLYGGYKLGKKHLWDKKYHPNRIDDMTPEMVAAAKKKKLTPEQLRAINAKEKAKKKKQGD